MIELPWPPAALKPNSSTHWRAKAPIKKQYRDDCYFLAKGLWKAPVPTEGKIHVGIVFYPPNARHFDLDNALASIKAGLDGLADALGINDKRFRPITIDMGEQREYGAVLIEFK